MINHILRPKHTLLSIAQQIENGLNNNTIYLADIKVVEADYETHDVDNIFSIKIKTLQLLVLFCMVVAIFDGFMVIFLKPEISEYFNLSKNYEFLYWVVLLWEFIVILAPVFISFFAGLIYINIRKKYLFRSNKS